MSIFLTQLNTNSIVVKNTAYDHSKIELNVIIEYFNDKNP